MTDIIKKFKTFNQIGTYFDVHSCAMERNTEKETNFLMNHFARKEAPIIDVMCGVGRLTNSLYENGYINISGVDIESYNEIKHSKLFKFYLEDFYNWSENIYDRYTYAYSLYNCYSSMQELGSLINGMKNIVEKNGLIIFDVFNYEWRCNQETNYKKGIYAEGDEKVVLTRSINKDTKLEQSIYEIFINGESVEKFEYNHRFFSKEEIYKICGDDVKIIQSDEAGTRSNSQKFICYLINRKGK